MACYFPFFATLESVVAADSCELKQKVHLAKKQDLPNGEKTTFEEFKALKEPYGHTVVKLPCGKCIGCRLDRSRDWANRCVLELPDHTESWFVTLTYDDDHLPYKTSQNRLTHEVRSSPTLVKEHITLFLKRLRKRFSDTTIRFFMCGEYGENNKRPHYHLILFGAPLSDNLRYLKSKNGNAYFSSIDLEELWPYGFNIVTSVTWETCAYVARYTQKKAVSGAFTEDSELRLPEFVNMSRRPGIGYRYFAEHEREIYDRDSLREGFKIPQKPPTYFDRLHQKSDLLDMLAIKERRRAFAEFAETKPVTDLDEFSYNELLALNKEKLINSRLIRR